MRSKLAERQRPKLRLQLLDALAQLPQLRAGRRGRLRGLCECGAPLLWKLGCELPRAGQRRVIRAARARQLLDREILVVAFEHVPLHAGEEIAACRRLSLL